MAEDKFEQAVTDKLKSEGWEYLTDYSGVTVLVYRWLLELSRQQMLRILWPSLNAVHMRQHGVFLGHRPSPGKPSFYSSAGCT